MCTWSNAVKQLLFHSSGIYSSRIRVKTALEYWTVGRQLHCCCPSQKTTLKTTRGVLNSSLSTAPCGPQRRDWQDTQAHPTARYSPEGGNFKLIHSHPQLIINLSVGMRWQNPFLLALIQTLKSTLNHKNALYVTLWKIISIRKG